VPLPAAGREPEAGEVGDGGDNIQAREQLGVRLRPVEPQGHTCLPRLWEAKAVPTDTERKQGRTMNDNIETLPTVFEGAVVRPLVTVEEAKRQWNEYVAFCDGVLQPDDYATIDGKKRKKKSAWRKLGRAFAVTDRIITQEVHRDADGYPLWATFTVEAEHPCGAKAIGYQEAHIREDCCPAASGQVCKRAAKNQRHNCCVVGCDGRIHWSHPGDLPATAHTRAKNRAIADLIGAGEVSAEEMAGVDESTSGSRPAMPKGRPVSRPTQRTSPSKSEEALHTIGALDLPIGAVPRLLGVANLKAWEAAGHTIEEGVGLCQRLSELIQHGWEPTAAIAEIRINAGLDIPPEPKEDIGQGESPGDIGEPVVQKEMPV